MFKKMILPAILGVLLAVVLIIVLQQVVMRLFFFAGRQMNTDWSGEHQEAGPVPLSNPEFSVIRLVNKKTTFPVGEQKKLRWDEGKGPIDPSERIKPLVELIPNELRKRLTKTILIPSKLPGDKGMGDYPLFQSWGVVVSLNPDVLILSVHELPNANDLEPLRNWTGSSYTKDRADYMASKLEGISMMDIQLRIYAGTLLPWNKEMHVFSTDPAVKNGRLQFDNNRAEILLPKGKLVLKHHDEDVDVARE